MDKDFDVNDFHKKAMEHMNQMRNTTHEHDYDYIVTNYSGTNMFFEICRVCMDTRGVVEI